MSVATTTSEIQLGPEQGQAVDLIRAWLRGDTKHEIAFSGAAGTGKSTVIGHIRRELIEAKCLFMAPTAKAAYVLRTKGVPCSTVHSVIYQFAGSYVHAYTDQEVPIFNEREDIKADFEPSFFVVDETSMIDLEMATAIRSKGKRTLWCGDSNQLECIGENPHIIDRPDIRLEQVYRQAGGSPILDLAHHIRLGGSPSTKFRAPGAVDVVAKNHPKSIAAFAIEQGYDQVIAGFNKTRHEVNRYMRDGLGMRGMLSIGDKLICRFNSRSHGIWNGMQFIVKRIVAEDEKSFTVDLQIDLGGKLGGVKTSIRIQKKSLGNPTYKTSERETGCLDMDYGYCVTAHASQGSSWPSVLYCWQPCRQWSMARHGYTGVTRAERRVGIAL